MKSKAEELTLFPKENSNTVEKEKTSIDRAYYSLIKMIESLQKQIDDVIIEDKDIKENLKLGNDLAKTLPALIAASEQIKNNSLSDKESNKINELIVKDDVSMELSKKLLERLSELTESIK
jgi:hypothetical protein